MISANRLRVHSYVGGQPFGGETSVDINPARPDEVIAEVELADADTASQAIAAARDAFERWRALPAPTRGEYLRLTADHLEAAAEPIGIELSREEGKTLREAVGEVRRAVGVLRYFAAQTLEPDGETYPSSTPQTFLYARREPVGVVLAITPWNFPIAIAAWKIAPALAYGNTVVWKPAELTPVTAVRLYEAFQAAGLPAGVLNLVLGRGSVVGDALTGGAVDLITFTGSNAVGKRVQAQAVERGIKVQMELGGKNPAVVLADADLERAASEIARGAFNSTGQKCTATSRVIVDESVRAEFTDRLATIARQLKVGDPLESDTNLGPLVSDAARSTVREYLEIARQEGGEIITGGDFPEIEGGFYAAPTVIEGLTSDSRVMREEIFGPVAAILPVNGYDEAIVAANDTPFGLSASVFTTNLSAALAFANEIEAGIVRVNLESAGGDYNAPFGGMKGSGSGGREQGKAAREFFTQWKTVYLE